MGKKRGNSDRRDRKASRLSNKTKMQDRNMEERRRRRLMYAVADELDRSHMGEIAAMHGVNVIVARQLWEFQDSFLVSTEDPWDYVGQLQVHQKSITRMGRLFEDFRLAKYVKGSGLSWRPRKVLQKILLERLSPHYSLPEDKDKLNNDVIGALTEIANVLEFIERVFSAFGLPQQFAKSQRPKHELRELLASSCVRNVFPTTPERGTNIVPFNPNNLDS
jgi:hypothetical protein